jgi:flagellar basal-body rod modification protein FlgD
MVMTGVTRTSSDSSGTQSPTPAATNPVDKLANEQTFLTLLVKQIQNQDPLNPTDGTQFVAQLAQFSQLEQLIGIRQELSGSANTPSTTNASSGTPATTGN